MPTDQTHDATSIVAQIAGLSTSRATPITAAQLVDRFCSGADTEYLGRPACCHRRDDTIAADIDDGFCGYSGGRGDELVTGFDDGYAFMGYLADRGWRSLPSLGDWPYVVYLVRRGSDREQPALVRYVEADLTVWRFDTVDDLRRFLTEHAAA
ncbi:MAG: hypothetical protein JHD16_00295 [Solirubrobacteraceae bacterium]|nr:hypothetical protein [Solirubrobacteraceae bacterium]